MSIKLVIPDFVPNIERQGLIIEGESKSRELFLKKLAGMDPKVINLAKSLIKAERLKEAWRDLWAQYAAMIEAFDGLIYICSQNYKIEFMNQRFIKRTGYYPLVFEVNWEVVN